MRHTSTCILNHRNTTCFAKRDAKWWAKHEHPDVKMVQYDDDGNVLIVVRDGCNVRWIEDVSPRR